MRYDAIVIGSGAGGGAAAAVLAEAGHSVLVLEQGAAIGIAEDPRDHLLPLGDPLPGLHDAIGRGRAVVAGGATRSVLGAVGGGTLVWGMQAWRFHPTDFRMASTYGVPAGSSLADWPFDYEELEPWYLRAERELGVAGGDAPYAPRSAALPMPPQERGPAGERLTAGAAARGWRPIAPPLAVNSIRYQGRDACIRCSECIGFTCPVNAKNGSQNAFLPRALATGACELRTGAQATRLLVDSQGRVEGVEFLQGTERREARADAIVLAGGAIETARLLLLSVSPLHKAGIGNEHDQVGRHLQGHTYAAALGLLPAGVENPNRGPGVTVATTAFNHGNEGIVGGAMMADDFVKTPVNAWRSLPPDAPRWGAEGKAVMRDLYLRIVDVRAPVHEIPVPDNRVTLHRTERDRAGLPLAELAGRVHPETRRTHEFMKGRLIEWLEASGMERPWTPALRPRGMSDWFHQAGTCRMSDDPRDGVVDPSGRVHGHDNLFVADGSLHVTNGGFNPALTIFALALRTASAAAEHLA